MKARFWIAVAVVAAMGEARPASAGEGLAGFFAHGLATTRHQEGGVDALIGYRTDTIQALRWLGKPSVHIIIAANNTVSTDFVAVGLNWPIKLDHAGRWYFRPGMGLAYNTGKAEIGDGHLPGLPAAVARERIHVSDTRIDFGSHDLFEPELALGYRFAPHWSAEMSYVHLSNGEILHQGKNQGLDDLGFRIAYRFGGR